MKKNTKQNYVFIVASLICFVIALIFHAYAIAAFVILFSYVAHAILFTDHIYYSPKSDYQFNFGAASDIKAILKDGQLSLAEAIAENIDTCILSARITSNFSGRIFDPYVEITSDGISSRQYFERGTNGQRFLNLSRFSEMLKQKDSTITIATKFCKFNETNCTLSGFSNPDYCSSRVLIISPHADDAELAAFGLYKNTASVYIATISAGEVDAESFEVLTKGNKESAGLMKGLLRAWDSVAIPLWGGRHIQAVHLGYFCMTLKAMHEQPEKIIPSNSLELNHIKPFRVFNKQKLPNDINGENSWKNLINDLTTIISEYQPEIIVTPHPVIDPQPDHLYSTRAALIACEAAQVTPEFLLYANHYHHTDMYPFGPEHSDLPLPPHFDNKMIADKLYSFPLSDVDQVDKICALQMMHDLNRPTPLKKRFRRFLQRMIGRTSMPYGDDEYLRKAIRQQELFWVTSLEKLKKEFKQG